MEGFVAVTRCAVGVLCSLGRNDFFRQGGSIFPDARRPCPDRSSGCWVPAFPKGGFPTSDERMHRRGMFGRRRRVCPWGGKRPSSYRASRCGFPVPRPPVRRDPSSSRGGARHGSIGAGRGGGGRCAEEGPSRGTALSPAGCSRGRPDCSGFVCRPSRSGTVCVEGKGRNLRGGKFRVAKGSFAERAFCGSTVTPARTFLFAVGFGLSVSRRGGCPVRVCR